MIFFLFPCFAWEYTPRRFASEAFEAFRSDNMGSLFIGNSPMFDVCR